MCFLVLLFYIFLGFKREKTPLPTHPFSKQPENPGVGFGDGEAIEATTGRVFHGPTQVTILGA